MLRTLALLRMRCGCFDTEVEEEGGITDSVWTFKKLNKRLKGLQIFLETNTYCPNKWGGGKGDDIRIYKIY